MTKVRMLFGQTNSSQLVGENHTGLEIKIINMDCFSKTQKPRLLIYTY